MKNILLTFLVFGIVGSTALSGSALSKFLNYLNKDKKEYSVEFKRCLDYRQEWFTELDIQRGDFSDNEEYFSSIYSRAKKYCESTISETRWFKENQE